MAAVYNAGSWAGLGILYGFTTSLLLLIIGLELRRHLPMPRVLAALVLLFILLVPSILARPHVLAWPMLAIWTVILMRAREAHRPPGAAAALLMVLWANLHGSFLFGLVIAALFGLEALIEEEDRWAVVRGWGLFGAASLVCALLTPFGIEGLLFPVQVSGMKTLGLIQEWRPSSLTRDTTFFVALAAVGLLLVLRRPHIPWPRLLLLALILFLAIEHARHQALLAIVGTLIVGASFGSRHVREPSGRSALPLAAALALGLVLLSVLRVAVPISIEDTGTRPNRAIAAVPQTLRTKPVFNSYSFGGPLILAGISPFIDGRADMYGDDFVLGSRTIEDGNASAFREAVKRWHIAWAIVAPGTGIVAVLDREPGWQRIYADKHALIYEGPTAAQ